MTTRSAGSALREDIQNCPLGAGSVTFLLIAADGELSMSHNTGGKRGLLAEMVDGDRLLRLDGRVVLRHLRRHVSARRRAGSVGMTVRPDVTFEFWFGDEPPLVGKFKTKVAFDQMTPEQWGLIVAGVQDLIYQYEKYEVVK